MRQDISDLPIHEKVDQEGLPAQRDDRIIRAFQFPQRSLNGGDFWNMAQLTGHAKILGIRKIRADE